MISVQVYPIFWVEFLEQDGKRVAQAPRSESEEAKASEKAAVCERNASFFILAYLFNSVLKKRRRRNFGKSLRRRERECTRTLIDSR
jgi:hypothetical protein